MPGSIWEWTFWLFVAACHFGTMLTAYNRLNSIGAPRRWLKRIGKLMFAWTLALPLVVVIGYGTPLMLAMEAASATGSGRGALAGLMDWLSTLLAPLPMAFWIYFAMVVAVGVWQFFPWLVYRPPFGFRRASSKRTVEVHDLANACLAPLPRSRKCRWMARIPGNQMFELAVEHNELPVADLPEDLDGYRIAHFSDLHFTGHIGPEMTQKVVTIANDWAPNAMICTGDLIDRSDCHSWLAEAVGHAKADDGCYYILGNHDRRISAPDQTRHLMNELGWIDVGGRCQEVRLGGVDSWIVGNEYPWFERPLQIPEDDRFRLLLSHSPDQIEWARQWRFPVMFAGHTHGGQGRLPIVGPLISPSRYGSRFAGGDFDFPPTTMHVNRGLSGTHLIRIRCRPELSLVTLRRRKPAA